MTAAQLAEAVRKALNAAEFSVEFTAVRVAVPTYKLEDMGTLHVTVVPRAVEIALGSRRDNAYAMGVDVAVQQRLAAVDNDTVDALIGLVQEIVDHMTRRHLGDSSEARWRRTKVEPLYSPEHLREMRQFTSVIRLDYEEQRTA